VISGNTAIGATTLTGVTEIENISISNTTTAVALTLPDGSITANVTVAVTTAQTTGALTFTSGSTTSTKAVSVTGGGGDDSLTGGSGNDTLNGGNGSDTIIGGAGVDTIDTGSGNNNVDGGDGSDTITLGSGADTVQFTSIEAIAVTYTDTITGFTTGAGGDSIRFGIGDLDSDVGGGNVKTLSNGNGGDIAAAIGTGSAVLLSVAPGAAVNITNGGAGGAAVDIIKFSSTTSTSVASALGAGSIATANMTANTEGVLAVYYDATNSRAVFGAFFDTDTTVADTFIAAEFQTIAFVGMTAAEYTAMTNANIAFGG